MKTSQSKRDYIGKDLEVMANAVNYYNWLIEEFGPYIGREIMEVGAGSGTFTEYLLKTNTKKLHTLEPSTENFSILKDRFSDIKRVSTFNGFLNEYPKEVKGKIDTMMYINVLEHVEKDEEELSLMNEFLKPGGFTCIYVPAMQSIYGKFDEKVGHYRRYAKKELKGKMKRAGFKIKMLHYSDIYGVIPWLISFKLLKKEDLGGGQVSIYDKLAVPVIRLQEKLFKPPFGKNLWAVGQKV